MADDDNKKLRDALADKLTWPAIALVTLVISLWYFGDDLAEAILRWDRLERAVEDVEDNRQRIFRHCQWHRDQGDRDQDCFP